jgi:leukotriene-A4 hydrolase
MKLRSRAGLALLLASSLALGAERAADSAPPAAVFDYHTYANVDQFRITNLQIDLKVDLKQQSIDGVAVLNIKRLDPRATQLVLDTKNLMIIGVGQKAPDLLGATAKSQTVWVSRPFRLEKPDPILGSAMIIDLPPSKRPSETLRIDYETLPAADSSAPSNSSALQWLSAKQTARHKPFLYTRSQPIGARTWIPLQDTPQVRATFKAVVHTDSDFRAVMSVANDPKAKHNGEYTFSMPQPVPSYLIALAVGDLEFKETGLRSGVYAEKSTIKEAAKEFADTESMIQAGEKLFGPYRWGRFDVLVMPPGYPQEGMENPCLWFISATFLAGDQKSSSLIARGLAASWAGNLVGNATWRDLWLNAGFSNYVEGRVLTQVYGQQRASMEAAVGQKNLRNDLAKLAPTDQVLALDLQDRDPAEAFSAVPTEKGRLFFDYLDALYGREHFDAFLKGYFDRFAFKSITTEQFLSYLQENLLDRYPGRVARDQVKAWIFSPGLPADALLPVTAMFQPVDEARAAWLKGMPLPKKFGADWTSQQWRYFLGNMPAALTATQLAELDKAFGFTKSKNAGIAQSWFLLVIAANYQPSFASLEEYLIDVGRLKLIEPLYEMLMKTPSGTLFAKRVFAKARAGYHPDTVTAIQAMVDPKPESSE